MTSPKYETPRFLPDLPVQADKKAGQTAGERANFNFREYAVTLARLIADKQTVTPMTIGVSGAWGAGKTTLLRVLREMLDATASLGKATQSQRLPFMGEQEERPEDTYRRCKTVWFDVWKYEGEDQILAALLRVVVEEMRRDGFWGEMKKQLAGPKKEEIRWLDLLLEALTSFVSVGAYRLDLGDFRVETPLKQASAFFDYFDASFERLLSAWVGGQPLGEAEMDAAQGVLVVFIDDLDRCLPKKIIEVLEAVKLFLDKTGCVFVLGAHTDVIREAVKRHYLEAGLTEQDAADYLEKFIQLRFDLPPIPLETLKAYLTAEGVDEELQQQWQVLVTGAELNLRKVKTFINDLNLQWAILQNTGKAQGVMRDDFTKWQVLMRAAPPEFKRRIFDMDDLDLRLKFVQDALKWSRGEGGETLAKTFQDYEKFPRLRRVLRAITAFSGAFDSAALEAFVHLETPPQKPPAEKAAGKAAPAEEEVPAAAGEAQVRKGTRRRSVPDETRAAMEAAQAKKDRLVIGGLEFVPIPAGKFLMGSKEDNPLAYDDEKPQHTLELPEFWMAKFPVTNEQYAAFCGREKHPLRGWEKKKNHPVVGVSWNDAMAYCRWFNQTYADELKRHGLTLHLPTEAQWEKAARGEYGNEWPWGNEFDPKKCNADEGSRHGTTPVDAYPQGESPYGVADMVGNVWEWTHTLFREYPYQAGDGRESEKDAGSRVLRGGSFNGHRKYARCAYRDHNHPDDRDDYRGFRVCVSPIS